MLHLKKNILYTGLMLVSLLLLGACAPRFGGSPTQAPELLYTQAAVTIVTQLTLEAGEAAAAQLTQIASQPTPTSTATLPPPTATLEPSPTPIPPTATPVPPTTTPLPPTATTIPCNLASLVKDVTVADGTQFEPFQYFTKTWRLKNVGSCTWQKTYDIVFARGDRMNGTTTGLDLIVKPGETVDISVNMRAPNDQGNYSSYWMLRDNNGNLFGLGNTGETPFWVNIKVTPSKVIVFDLAEKYCDATWTSTSGTLPCPGVTSSTSTGYVIKDNKPQLESGSIDDEPALFVRVDDSGQGYIQGRYPEFSVKSGDRFRAIIGCAYPNKSCYVQFELLYSVDGKTIQSLGSWDEKNEGQFVRLDIDLSSLRDKKVTFILKVSNNSNSNDDVASWLHPRVVR